MTHADPLDRIEHRAAYGGWQDVWEHDAATLGCRMRFGFWSPLPAWFFPGVGKVQ